MSTNTNRVADGDNNCEDKDNDIITSQIKLLSLTVEHEEKQEQNDDSKQQYEYEEDKDGNAIEGIRFVNYKDESQLESIMSLVSRDLSEPYSIFTYRYFLHQWPDLCIIAHNNNDQKVIGCVVCKIDEEEDEFAMDNDDEDDDNGPGIPLPEPSPSLISIPAKSTEIDDNNDGNIVNNENKIIVEQEQQLDQQVIIPPPTPTNSNQQQQIHQNNDKANKKIKSGYMAMLAVDKNYRNTGIGTELVKRVVNRMKNKGCNSVMLETEVSNKVAMRLYEDRLGFIRDELLVRYYLNYGDAYRLRLWFVQTSDL